jgi:hypothetical protein
VTISTEGAGVLHVRFMRFRMLLPSRHLNPNEGAYGSHFSCLLSLDLVFCCLPLTAQVQLTPPLRVVPDLQQITRSSGLIFAGTVTSIAPVHAADSDRVNRAGRSPTTPIGAT